MKIKDFEKEVKDCIEQGFYLNAVKFIKDTTGLNLKESKDLFYNHIINGASLYKNLPEENRKILKAYKK